MTIQQPKFLFETDLAAFLALTVDAIDGRLVREAIDAAELGFTNDAQDDAQLACELHLAEPRVPLWIDKDE